MSKQCLAAGQEQWRQFCIDLVQEQMALVMRVAGQLL
jgi:hypothetical protein